MGKYEANIRAELETDRAKIKRERKEVESMAEKLLEEMKEMDEREANWESKTKEGEKNIPR